MTDGILTSIKKMLGLPEEYTHFDSDIIFHINTVLIILNQMGVGENAFLITGTAETWDDYLEGNTNLELIKTYVYLKVRMIFDPPMAASVTQAIKDNINELEWRISVTVDPPTVIDDGGETDE